VTIFETVWSIIIFVCTAICVASAWFSVAVSKENRHLRLIVARLRYWYARLFRWAGEQGLEPPTPRPGTVAGTPTPDETRLAGEV